MRQVFLRVTLGILVCFVTLAVPSFLEAQNDGATIFKSKCALCHGANGAGDSPTGKALKVKDLRSDETQKQSDADLSSTIAKGRNKMPAFGERLKPEEIQQVVAYIRQLGKK